MLTQTVDEHMNIPVIYQIKGVEDLKTWNAYNVTPLWMIVIICYND